MIVTTSSLPLLMLSSTNDCAVCPSLNDNHTQHHHHPTSTTATLDRRSTLQHILSSTTLLPTSFVLLVATTPTMAHADFAPGGTLLDRTVSVTYGNPDASPSRLRDIRMYYLIKIIIINLVQPHHGYVPRDLLTFQRLCHLYHLNNDMMH
jgi:hypothetical protein